MHPTLVTIARSGALFLGLAATGAHAGLPRYDCTVLSPAGNHQYAEPKGINKYGRVVGKASVAGDGRWTWGAFQWKDDSHAVRLDPLLPPGYISAEAVAINEDNLIVGTAQPACDVDCWPTHPVSWHGRTAMVLPLPEGSISGRAHAVNRHGRIVGRYTLPDSFTEHAAMWHAGRVRDLGTLGSRKNAYWQDSAATAVNEAGTIVGFSQTDEVTIHAARWDADGQVHDLGGLLDSSESLAWSLNSSGLVVGNSTQWVDGHPVDHAVAWVDGHVVDLDPQAPADARSTAIQVNDAGEIVGYKLKPNGSVAALYWPRWDHKPVHLSELIEGSCRAGGESFTLGYTHAINDDGVIVSVGRSDSGRTAAFRLTRLRAD